MKGPVSSEIEPAIIVDENFFDLLVEILTATGSRYWVGRDSRTGRWWLRGENVPNPNSARMDSSWWEIEPPDPWPIQIGKSVMLYAPRDWAMNDMRRVPGGGKVTSPVRKVRVQRGGSILSSTRRH